MKLAYLLSEYPTVQLTYLLREVREMRALGWDIQTISVRPPARHGVALSPIEAEEQNSTWYLLGSGAMTFLAAHVLTFADHPLRYLRGLFTAWQYGRLSPHRTWMGTAYFAEAVLAGHLLSRAGIRHVHSVYSTTVALLLATVFDAEMSMTIHGPQEFVDPEGFWILQKVHTSRFASAISYFGKSQLMQWSSPADWHKLEITPLGIDLTDWPTTPVRERPAPFELISVGRLAAVKGYAFQLDAVALLVAQSRDVRLTLVGDGPERMALEDHARRLGIADRIIFAGWQDQEHIRELYRNSDLCVLASFAEGIPVVLMEAMATGVPCVASRITGIPELIRDGIEGRLVTPANTEELAAAIAELMDNPELRRRMGAASRERVADKFNLQKNVRRLSEIFSRYFGDGRASAAASR